MLVHTRSHQTITADAGAWPRLLHSDNQGVDRLSGQRAARESASQFAAEFWRRASAARVRDLSTVAQVLAIRPPIPFPRRAIPFPSLGATGLGIAYEHDVVATKGRWRCHGCHMASASFSGHV
jgi:hypothetical protein